MLRASCARGVVRGGLQRVLRRQAAGQAAASYSKLTDADIAFFRSILAENDVITDASALEQYNVDWMKKYEGKSKLALRPRSTQQVSQILKHCNERKLPIVPQGGNTGLVGGSVAVHDEVVLSLSGMDKILAFDEFSGTVTCQAGAVLQAVQEKAESFGYTFPLDLGAKGSCQIGGNVATNAGGLRYLRYGSLHGTVLGIEAVLADGTIVDNLNTLKKDNTGYDVKQLFIGSEGTLGVVTGVAIALPKLPNSVQLAYLALDSYESVLNVFREAKGHLAEVLSAVEFLDDQALGLTLKHLHGARNPLQERVPFYMLIEVSGSNEEHDAAKLSGFLEHVMETGMVSDGTLAADSTQMAGARALVRLALRRMRAMWESMPQAMRALRARASAERQCTAGPLQQGTRGGGGGRRRVCAQAAAVCALAQEGSPKPPFGPAVLCWFPRMAACSVQAPLRHLLPSQDGRSQRRGSRLHPQPEPRLSCQLAAACPGASAEQCTLCRHASLTRPRAFQPAGCIANPCQASGRFERASRRRCRRRAPSTSTTSRCLCRSCTTWSRTRARGCRARTVRAASLERGSPGQREFACVLAPTPACGPTFASSPPSF